MYVVDSMLAELSEALLPDENIEIIAMIKIMVNMTKRIVYTISLRCIT